MSITKVFIFWYQGWIDAPEIVQICLDSWLKSQLDIIMIDGNNYSEYVNSDQRRLLQKVEGLIGKSLSYQHFADLLRLCLLANNLHSVWADATVYLVSPDEFESELNDTVLFPRGRTRRFETWLIFNGVEIAIFDEWSKNFNSFLSLRFKEIDDWDKSTWISRFLRDYTSYRFQRFFYLSNINRILFRYRTYFHTNFIGERLLGHRLDAPHAFFTLDTQVNEIIHYSPECTFDPLMAARVKNQYALKLNTHNQKLNSNALRLLKWSGKPGYETGDP